MFTVCGKDEIKKAGSGPFKKCKTYCHFISKQCVHKTWICCFLSSLFSFLWSIYSLSLSLSRFHWRWSPKWFQWKFTSKRFIILSLCCQPKNQSVFANCKNAKMLFILISADNNFERYRSTFSSGNRRRRWSFPSDRRQDPASVSIRRWQSNAGDHLDEKRDPTSRGT